MSRDNMYDISTYSPDTVNSHRKGTIGFDILALESDGSTPIANAQIQLENINLGQKAQTSSQGLAHFEIEESQYLKPFTVKLSHEDYEQYAISDRVLIPNSLRNRDEPFPLRFMKKVWLCFDGESLQAQNTEEVRHELKISSINFSKESLKESKDYKIKIDNTLSRQEPYRLNILDSSDKVVGFIANSNEGLNPKICLEDKFGDFIMFLGLYRTHYRKDEIRLEVEYGEGEEISWIKIARAELGVLEIEKTQHNPRIIEYHSTTTGKFQDDETPWCSSFVNWVMTQAGLKGTNSARAASWKDWGQKLDKPAYGCIGVKIRANGTGHVGFIVGKTKEGRLVSLGGNQDNEVNYRGYEQDFFQFFVYPLGHTPDYNLPEIDDKIIKKGGKTR